MGSATWHNMRAHGDGAELIERMYASIYSDADLTGDFSVGPVEITRLDDLVGLGDVVRPVARIDVHWSPPQLVVDGELAPTSAKAYHGGGMSDEITALLSLALQIRCRTGGRWWSHGIGPERLGEPPFAVDFPEPTSPAHPRGLEVLPRLTGERDVGAAADLIASYPGLSEKNGIALMQAARQYQLGVWVANEDPNLAWLRLVGAVEVAAGTLKVPKQSYVDQARELHPDFAGELDGLDPDVAERIAKSVSNVIGATRKFLYFLEKFCPAAPGERPDDHDQVDWNALGPMFKQIYGYRSDALHNGRPFPAPMCEVPRTDVNEVPIERAWGLSSAADNASWTKEEYPMLLATFEFIVRGALINWWEQLPAS